MSDEETGSLGQYSSPFGKNPVTTPRRGTGKDIYMHDVLNFKEASIYLEVNL
jgi:hypothetical protein